MIELDHVSHRVADRLIVYGVTLTIARGDIDAIKPSSKSLMPEGLLKGLGDQDVRDLFAYLRSTQPLPE